MWLRVLYRTFRDIFVCESRDNTLSTLHRLSCSCSYLLFVLHPLVAPFLLYHPKETRTHINTRCNMPTNPHKLYSRSHSLPGTHPPELLNSETPIRATSMLIARPVYALMNEAKLLLSLGNVALMQGYSGLVVVSVLYIGWIKRA